MEFFGERALPRVQIVTTNSGQSPAHHFVWNPTVTYRAAGRNLETTFDPDWEKEKGISIDSQGEASVEALVTSFFLVDFLQGHELDSAGNFSLGPMIVVRVNFQYLDVFGVKQADVAEFAGTIYPRKMPAKPRPMESKWAASLIPILQRGNWPPDHDLGPDVDWAACGLAHIAE